MAKTEQLDRTEQLPDDTVDGGQEGAKFPKAPPGGSDFFASLREIDWTVHLAYVSRNEPFRPNTDRNPYLVKYTEAFDEETIKLAYGSGVYVVRLNKRLPNGRDKTVNFYKFTIIDRAFPPVLVGYDGWEKDPRNRPWLWAHKGGAETAAHAAPQPGGLDVDGVLKIVDRVTAKLENPKDKQDAMAIMVQALQTGHQNAIAMITEAANANSPEKVIALVTALKGLMQTEQPAGGTGLAVVKEVMGAVKEIITLTRPAEQARPNGLVELKDMLGVLREAREVLGPGGEDAMGPGGTTKWDLYAELARQGGLLAQAVTQGIMAWRASKAAGAISVPSGTPAVASAANPVPEAAAALPAPVGREEQQQPPKLSQEQLFILGQIGPALVQHVTGDVELPGLSLAAWIEAGYGPVLAPSLAQLGPDSLLAIVQSHPPLWAQLQPFEPQLRAVLAEFCTWPAKRDAFMAGELPEQQDEEPSEPAKRSRRAGGKA